MKDGFVKVAAVTPVIKLGDCIFNADEMIRKLQLISNRARQAKITNELTEIINGAQQADNI